MAIIRKAYRLKLYPTDAQRQSFTSHVGACRWLWNHLLAMQKRQHEADGTFIFFHAMSKMLPGLKAEYPWLADAPSNALVRVAKNLDRVLKDSFRNGRSCGTRKTGADKLRLHQRTFRCACGAVLDRDRNAALNLRRIGIEVLCTDDPILHPIDVGRVTPERTGLAPVDACGDPSAGPVPQSTGRCGSRKQEDASQAQRQMS